jgi:hypothetical protein
VTLFDADTTHWDGGAIEVTLTNGGSRGDCLCLLSEEQQRTVRKIFADRSGGSNLAISSRAAVTAAALSSSPPLLGEQSVMMTSSMMLGTPAGGGALRNASVSFDVPQPPVQVTSPNVNAQLPMSARPFGKLGTTNNGFLASDDVVDGHAAAVRMYSNASDPTNSWVVLAEPPFPTASHVQIDPSQHGQNDVNAAVHGSIFGVERTLHIKSLVDGTFVMRNIGTIYVDRAVQNTMGSSMLDLERSKLPAPPTPFTASLGDGVSFDNPTGGGAHLFLGSNLAAVPPSDPLRLAQQQPQPQQQNVVTLLRIDLSPPPEDDPYNPRITLDVMKTLITNIGFFNVVPFEQEHVSKTATIAIKDAFSLEPPAKQFVSIDCQPPYFYKPAAYCEPVLYTQRAAIENRFEFVFQKLRSMCCSPNGGDAKERMPLCTIEVFPTSGWLPRDTLMLRLSGSLYVLTQDGQVICSKEVVCKHTTVTANSIRAEITKDCKGATWAKVAGFLGLISYHFDMKDIGKDAPSAAAVVPPPPPPAPLSSQSGVPTLTTTPAPSGPSTQAAAAPNSVPQHDRLLALQITEPNVKDIEGRTETWALLQRISYSSGLASDQ